MAFLAVVMIMAVAQALEGPFQMPLTSCNSDLIARRKRSRGRRQHAERHHQGDDEPKRNAAEPRRHA